MQALTPPPLPAALHLPPPTKHTKPISLHQIVVSKQPNSNHQSLESISEPSNSDTKNSTRPPTTLRQPRLPKTNPIIWFAAILCLIFSLILIFFGVATLIIYLSIKPKNPIFDIPNATLNVIYFDSPEYFNGEFTLLANFSNPNKKMDLRFESLDMELFFSDRLISSQVVQPFTQRRREIRLQSINFISSLVFLPQDLGVKLQKQVESNRVDYNVRGTFRVRANLGIIHMSYWLHTRCQLEITSPPTGVLVARNCITKR